MEEKRINEDKDVKYVYTEAQQRQIWKIQAKERIVKGFKIEAKELVTTSLMVLLEVILIPFRFIKIIYQLVANYFKLLIFNKHWFSYESSGTYTPEDVEKLQTIKGWKLKGVEAIKPHEHLCNKVIYENELEKDKEKKENKIWKNQS